MEIIWRTLYHSLLTFFNRTTYWVDQDAYKHNIKRMRCILTNDYGRVSVGEEVQSDEEGTCSVATEIISTCDIDAELEEFECPGYEEGESGEITCRQSDGSQLSAESSSAGISHDSHGSKSKVH